MMNVKPKGAGNAPTAKAKLPLASHALKVTNQGGLPGSQQQLGGQGMHPSHVKKLSEGGAKQSSKAGLNAHKFTN